MVKAGERWNNKGLVILDSDGYHVATVNESGEEEDCFSDARLIAASPSLLAMWRLADEVMHNVLDLCDSVNEPKTVNASTLVKMITPLCDEIDKVKAQLTSR
jgi:hypothetical protein